MIVHKIELDVVPSKSWQEVRLNQDDDDYTIEATLTARSGTFTIESGTTAEIRGTKPDGTAYTAAATISGKVVTVKGDKKMTSAKGRGIFEITLSKSGKYLSTTNFFVNVECAALHTN